MFSLQVIFKFSNSLQVVLSIRNSLQVVFSTGSFFYRLFSNILDFFQIKQWVQAETYSETCQAPKRERFARLGSGCYEKTKWKNGCQSYQKEEWLLVLPTYRELSQFLQLCQQPNFKVILNLFFRKKINRKCVVNFRTR